MQRDVLDAQGALEKFQQAGGHLTNTYDALDIWSDSSEEEDDSEEEDEDEGGGGREREVRNRRRGGVAFRLSGGQVAASAAKYKLKVVLQYPGKAYSE